jgi:hypothetical protein
MATKKELEAAVVAAGFTKADLPKVMEALAEATADPPVGHVVRNPATGDVAVRVRQYTEVYWRVTSKDDRSWIETSLVGWDVLHQGTVEPEGVDEDDS